MSIGFLVFPFSCIFAQGTVEDYQRAEAIRANIPKALKASRIRYRWCDHGLIVEQIKAGQKTFMLVDGTSTETMTMKEAKESGRYKDFSQLLPQGSWSKSGGSQVPVLITFKNTFERPVRIFWVQHDGVLKNYGSIPPGKHRSISTFEGHQWVVDFSPNKLAGIFSAAAWDCDAILDMHSQQCAMDGFRKTLSIKEQKKKAGHTKLFIQDHNVWFHNTEQDEPITTDGHQNDLFLPRFHYSPNGKYAIGFQETQVTKRQIPLLTSAPHDQLQPTMKWIDYAKAGDAISQRRPRLFNLVRKQILPCDDSAFSDSWNVRFLRWSPDSERAYVLFNQRGHQRLALRSIAARTGRLRDIVDETSDTFIDYSQKTMIHWLDQSNELVWASERDGWNHLYRFDAVTGKQINQITTGEWVVRRIEHVDEDRGVIWFAAMGIHPEQDPYHIHLARVNLDGTGLIVLTEGDGTHQWEFNADRSLFVDRWSRVDLPEHAQLREAKDGTVLANLFTQDISELKHKNFTLPIRFASVGRDNETMIYGTLILPSTFNPENSYPVIEHIYAGPHDFHVQKKFGSHASQRRLAELGFVVAQIDGMGTNWRSKEFHDVCWKNLSDAGLPDRIAWLKAAAKQYPWIDLSRVGIYGGSAGGQNALAALLHHGNFYKAAASDCGCHDNRMDKIWWNEAWMGKVGPHYKQNSNVTHASKLRGDLFLTVGELDTNVDPASTLQVVDALIKNKKDFEFVLVPNGGHGVGESDYLFRRRQDFFVRSLLDVEPRR